MYPTDKTVAILKIMAGLVITGHTGFMGGLIILVCLAIVIKREFSSST